MCNEERQDSAPQEEQTGNHPREIIGTLRDNLFEAFFQDGKNFGLRQFLCYGRIVPQAVTTFLADEEIAALQSPEDLEQLMDRREAVAFEVLNANPLIMKYTEQAYSFTDRLLALKAGFPEDEPADLDWLHYAIPRMVEVRPELVAFLDSSLVREDVLLKNIDLNTGKYKIAAPNLDKDEILDMWDNAYIALGGNPATLACNVVEG